MEAKQSKVKVEHYKHLSKYIVRKKIMVDETRTKEIEHQDLHGNPNREKTTGRGALNLLYQREYKEKRGEEEEKRVTMFSASLDLTLTIKP